MGPTTRITIDVNDEWLEAAREILGTQTKVATVNEALRSFAVRKQAPAILAALDIDTCRSGHRRHGLLRLGDSAAVVI